VLLPSPSEEQFAGPGHAAFGAYLLSELYASDSVRALVNLGYDYDTEFAELRRFGWTVAGVLARDEGYTVDAGFSGSEYEQGIEWTPAVARGVPTELFPQGLALRALDDNRLGRTYFSFVGGFRISLGEVFNVGGTITVPIVDTGFAPDVTGTAFVEGAF
jgi:hypothetical protein